MSGELYCEFALEWYGKGPEFRPCGNPAVASYPAMGGLRMDLCEGHAARFADIAQVMELRDVRTGEIYCTPEKQSVTPLQDKEEK